MKRIGIVLLTICLTLMVVPPIANASQSHTSEKDVTASLMAAEKFIDSDHWIEVTSSDVTTKYNANEKFVVMFFRHTCFNSNLRKAIVKSWMGDYGIDVYGVDVDTYTIPSWVWSKLGGGSVTLPVICIIDNGIADCFTAKDSMRVIQARVNDYLEITDSREYDFSRLNRDIYNRYSTDATDFLPNMDSVADSIISEAANIVKDCGTDMEKLKAIYDWMTTNIYYNFGMLDGTVERQTSAEYTYFSRNSVCSGYANLTEALCHAAGIPCRVVTGFATGIGSDEFTETVWNLYQDYLNNGDKEQFYSNVAPYENHAWNEAFVDGWWIILDTTWGSNNDYYPSRGMIAGAPSDEYFNPDISSFSETHLFWNTYEVSGEQQGIYSIALNGKTVTSSITCSETDASIFCGIYTNEGKMISVQVVRVKGETTQTYQFQFESEQFDYAKIFVLDRNLRPIYVSTTVSKIA